VLRQLARAVREFCWIPGPDEPRPQAPGPSATAYDRAERHEAASQARYSARRRSTRTTSCDSPVVAIGRDHTRQPEHARPDDAQRASRHLVGVDAATGRNAPQTQATPAASTPATLQTRTCARRVVPVTVRARRYGPLTVTAYYRSSFS
jgi:hypothetical protein